MYYRRLIGYLVVMAILKNKFYFTLMLFLLFAGCSVKPLYMHDSESSTKKPCDIYVDVIAGRDGQKLRSHLMDSFRDIRFSRKKCRLSVNIMGYEKSFAIAKDGAAKRVLFTYDAYIVLRDNTNKVIFKRKVSTSTSYNIAHSHGEVTLSLYGRHNDALLKDLCNKIVENIKMSLSCES
jgi:hypothetical protein